MASEQVPATPRGTYALVDSGFAMFGKHWTVGVRGQELVVNVGNGDTCITGRERDRFAEAVARAVTPGQVSG